VAITIKEEDSRIVIARITVLTKLIKPIKHVLSIIPPMLQGV